MKCSNCGKKIPYTGQVCPWCHADKSADKSFHAYVSTCAILGTFIGLLADQSIGALIGLAAGVFMGGFLVK